jgi:hypothetical protein
MANKVKPVTKKTKVVPKKTTPAPKKSKVVVKKPIVVAKKKIVSAKKTAIVVKKKPIAVKKTAVVIKKKPIAAKKAVVVKKKPIVVRKPIVVAKPKAVAVKKVAAKPKQVAAKKVIAVKLKPIEVKKPIVAVKSKPIEEKEEESGFKKRPAAFSKPIGSAKKRRSRARKALIPNKQETGDEENKRVPWNKKPAEKKKRLIIERPSMRSLPESDEPKKIYTGPKKIKYQVEMNIHASPRILFPFLSTSSGLAEWFAPHVNDRNNIFTFEWEGSSQVAKLVTVLEYESVRFHWLDDADETYFEIKLEQDEMTGDVAIIITDFCLAEEKQENMRLWESQIHDLMHVVGSQF